MSRYLDVCERVCQCVCEEHRLEAEWDALMEETDSYALESWNLRLDVAVAKFQKAQDATRAALEEYRAYLA